MWNTMCNRQPRLSRNTVGCYNARIVLSNIDSGISKQLFLQQLASLQSTDHDTENIWRSMTFSFENLFVALWGLHRAQIGQHNGRIFCMSGICVDHWSHASGISSWSKKCMTQYWHFVSYIANLPAERWVRRTLAWQPRPTYPPRGRPQQTWDTKLEMFCRYKAVGNWEIVARNAAQWDSVLPCFLDFCSM